jgi:PKD repeat protein
LAASITRRKATNPWWLTLVNGVLSGTPAAAGIYQFTLTATNAAGSGSAVMTLEVQATPGQLTRDLWTSGVTGAALANVPWTSPPSSSEDATTTYADNTGERLRGYLTVPVTSVVPPRSESGFASKSDVSATADKQGQSAGRASHHLSAVTHG